MLPPCKQHDTDIPHAAKPRVPKSTCKEDEGDEETELKDPTFIEKLHWAPEKDLPHGKGLPSRITDGASSMRRKEWKDLEERIFKEVEVTYEDSKFTMSTAFLNRRADFRLGRLGGYGG